MNDVTAGGERVEVASDSEMLKIDKRDAKYCRRNTDD
jgi:hypothetical protein